MNATVTRSATKTGSTKGASKTAVKAVTPAKDKTSAKSAKGALLKTAGGKPTAPHDGAFKRATKNSSGTTKSVAKPAQSTVKSNAAPTARVAAENSDKGTSKKKTSSAVTRASATRSTPASARKATVATAATTTATAPALKAGSKRASGASLSGNNSSDGLIDKMGQPVVSKVSEVATKTTKSSPATRTDGALLTEEQILKMSDKDYMNEAQLAFFKARLQQLERDLLKNAGETTEHLRETVLVPDPADRATIEEEHALELRTRDRERKLLKKVQQSIASIDAGEYGWCEETGEPIGIPRLLARPTATLSLEAQQRRELKQKLYGD